jgi:broad specificity phosphatase PhoE
VSDREGTTLLLVRHGHTAANDLGPDAPMSGWHDVPLSALGRWQIDALAGAYADRVRGWPLFSSPLGRARETALGLARGEAARVQVHPGLREISCGALEAVSLRDVEQQHPELWAANLRQDDDDFRWPGGESYRELRARVVGCLDQLVRETAARTLVLVTHAGVISQVMGHLTGTPPARWDAHRPGNASVTTLSWGEGHGRLLTFGDESHLAQVAQASARRRTRAHA